MVSKVSTVSAHEHGLGDFEVRRWRDELSETDFFEIRFRVGEKRRNVLLSCSYIDTPQKIVSALRDSGATLPRSRKKSVELVNSIIEQLPASVGCLASRSGWHDGNFLLAGQAYGCSSDKLRLTKSITKVTPKLGWHLGTLERWREQVALPAEASTLASFAILVAISASTSRLARLDEGVIFNLFGGTGTGKTTALHAAQSVLGAPQRMADWNVSIPAHFERAAALSDLPLVIDDMERFRPAEGGKQRTLSRIIHTLTAGSSTVYAESVQRALPALTWWAWAISTSPKSLREEFAEFGSSPTGGDGVRWIDIPVPTNENGGIWDRAPRNTTGSALAQRSEDLKRGAARNYGTAMRPWLRHLVNDKIGVTSRIATNVGKFVSIVCPEAAGEQRRIARKIGAVYAGGIEAVAMGILPWSEASVLRICSAVFGSVWTNLAGVEAAIQAVRAELRRVVTSPAVLPPVVAGTKPVFSDDAAAKGYVGRAKGREAVFLRREYLTAVCGNHLRRLLDDFTIHGALLPGHGGKATRQISVMIEGRETRPRMYAFDRARLLAALATDEKE